MSLNAKLAIGIAVVACATAYLAYLGASSSWRYYLHVDECVAEGAELQGCRLRVNGKIGVDSLRIRADRRLAQFTLRGVHREMQVTCSGPLPDNLVEDMDVVVEGSLEGNGVLRGDKVLTRCASKYEPDRVASSTSEARRS